MGEHDRMQPRADVVLRGQGMRAWLRSGELVLDGDGVRQRIPLSAIERVEAEGPRGATLVIVLTSCGSLPERYAIRSGSPSAVQAFVATVAKVVPITDADEPRSDGSRLVRVEPLPAKPKRMDEFQRKLLIGAGVWALLLGAIIVRGEDTERNSVLWAVAPLFTLPGAMCVHTLWTGIRDALVLPRHGITVVGDLVDTEVDSEGSIVAYVYEFTDMDGGVHRHRGMFGSEESIEITYDPSRPTRSRVHGHAGASALVTVFCVVLGVPMFVAGAAMTLVPLSDLLSGF
ncbi:DUF3592 domain-containing protein [Streptomyces mirabilis]|uniref:DUF3592 domain-containing protein n=1 Tax=Streptomyces mirabilis TaxID=68239 RepID=UPI0031BB0340